MYRLAQIVIAALLLPAAGFAQPQPKPPGDFDPQTARGTVSLVTALDDPQQSYWVYLPKGYTAERRWPILYAFDPFANGKRAVEVYQEAAEKYGYIVAGSNNSRNGPGQAEMTAAQAVWLDTHRRFAIERKRTYTTGLSGGARAATAFALYCYTCEVAGVIAHGASYPAQSPGQKPPEDHLAYYVAIGDADFNFPEIAALRKKKDEAGAPFKVKVYPGPHQWAPPEIVDDALAWLDLKAMQLGTAKVDAAFVGKQFEQTKAEAADAEQRGDALREYYALRSLVEDFKGLEDTSAFAEKLAQLRGSKAFKNAEHELERDIEKQRDLTETTANELGHLGAADADTQAALRQRIGGVMAELRKHANSTSSDHTVYQRAFMGLWVQGLEEGQEEFRENHLPQAQAYFELMAQAMPDQAWPLLLVAEVNVRAGNKKAALKAIEQAVQRGVKHRRSLTDDPELAPLQSDPEFQKIVQGISAE